MSKQPTLGAGRPREAFGRVAEASGHSIKRYLVALLLLIVLPGAGAGQPPPEPEPSQRHQEGQETIRVSVDLVVLHATVHKNRRRALVSGLGKEDFQIYEDGVLQEIHSFSHEDIPVTVGLVLDNSGSMIPKRQEVITATLAFARSSNPHDQIFLINFNENVSFGLPDNMPFTDDVGQLEVALSKTTANGMTALYDAVAVGLEHLQKGKQDKKVLIVISDGADNASRLNLAEIMTKAEQSDAIIYTLGLFEQGDPDRNPGVLKQLARATGGEAYLPWSVKEAVSICERIAHDIRNQYTLAYIPTNRKQDGTYRAVEVRAAAPSHGALSVRTRAGYYAPLAPQPLAETNPQ